MLARVRANQSCPVLGLEANTGVLTGGKKRQILGHMFVKVKKLKREMMAVSQLVH